MQFYVSPFSAQNLKKTMGYSPWYSKNSKFKFVSELDKAHIGVFIGSIETDLTSYFSSLMLYKASVSNFKMGQFTVNYSEL